MGSDAPDPPDDLGDRAAASGEQRLYRALEVYLAHRSGDGSAADLLARHPDLKDELQPLLASPVEPAAAPARKERKDELLPGQEIGDFRLIRRLGKGGMGIVFEAEQLSLRRRVALKVLSGEKALSPRRRARFRREAEAGGRLRHPNIVAVFSIGDADGRSFIAQELVEEGRTLADWIDEQASRGPPSREYLRRIAAFFAQAAEALQVAHEADVIHRDIKPANLLVTPRGEPKVADFGLAWVHAEVAVSRSGERVGTPYYMSPEQVDPDRDEIDERTDVYALGASLHEAITFQRPFDGESQTDVFRAILNEPARDPRAIEPAIPADLAAIATKAMEKRPIRRYATARALAQDLRRFLDGEPPLARSPSRLAVLNARLRRHRVAVMLCALAIVSLAAAGTYRGRAARLEREQRELSADKIAALRDANAVLIERLFDPAVLQSPAALDKHATALVARARERLADQPALAADLLESVAAAELSCERRRDDFDLAVRCLAEAAGRCADTHPSRAAALELQAAREEYDGGRLAESAARVDAILGRKPGGAVEAAARALAMLLERERGKRAASAGNERELETAARALLAVERGAAVRREALSIAARIGTATGVHALAIEALIDRVKEAGEGGGEVAAVLEARSRLAAERLADGDVEGAARKLADCLSERQEIFGDGGVGFALDQLRLARCELAQGRALGLPKTIESALERLERAGRGACADALAARADLAEALRQLSDSGAKHNRDYFRQQAEESLRGAIAAREAVSGAAHPQAAAWRDRLLQWGSDRHDPQDEHP